MNCQKSILSVLVKILSKIPFEGHSCKCLHWMNPSIVTIGSMKIVKTFFLSFPALNSTAMNKKLKYSNSYEKNSVYVTPKNSVYVMIINDFQRSAKNSVYVTVVIVSLAFLVVPTVLARLKRCDFLRVVFAIRNTRLRPSLRCRR